MSTDSWDFTARYRVASNLDRQISHFIMCYALFRTYSCFPQKCLMNRTKIESCNQVSCMKNTITSKISQPKARQTAIGDRKVSTQLACFLSKRMAFLKSDRKQYYLNFLWSILKLSFYRQLLCIMYFRFQ